MPIFAIVILVSISALLASTSRKFAWNTLVRGSTRAHPGGGGLEWEIKRIVAMTASGVQGKAITAG